MEGEKPRFLSTGFLLYAATNLARYLLSFDQCLTYWKREEEENRTFYEGLGGLFSTQSYQEVPSTPRGHILPEALYFMSDYQANPTKTINTTRLLPGTCFYPPNDELFSDAAVFRPTIEFCKWTRNLPW